MTEHTSRWARDFDPGGGLSKAMPGYETRAQQRRMAHAVGHAIEEGQRLLVEAPTGTGKTLAYLLPALRSGRRTLVSTATRSLQDQLLRKDAPLAARVLGREVDVVVLKGRSNYLCLHQAEELKRAPARVPGHEIQYWGHVQRWIDHTETGDRAELEDLPEDAVIWRELTIGADACLGSQCPHHESCFLVKARARAESADVVIVNHHLFFADLSLRREVGVELLPRTEVLIFDEAHHLEEIAAPFFGTQTSEYRYFDLLGDIRRLAVRHVRESGDEAQVASWSRVESREREARRAVEAWFQRLGQAMPLGDQRVERSEVVTPEIAAELDALRVPLDEAMGALRTELLAPSDASEDRSRLRDRIQSLGRDLDALLQGEAADLVYEVERRGRGVFLRATPVDVAPILQEELLPRARALVLASATLTVRDRFDFLRSRLGLPAATPTLQVDPVFDYRRQAVLYLPENLPQPNAPDFVERLLPEIARLVELTQGRALLLFTSYRNMEQAWSRLHDRWPWPVFKQGEAERTALLERFRRETDSVLFATQSFWEGVDVPGESLSLVVIDKLPFQSPADPLVRARSRAIEERGGNSFRDYSLPMAVLSLKQGFGRLVRQRTDIGIVALLDRRLVDKPYGQVFLTSLPPAFRTRDPEKVRQWWEGAQQHVARLKP